MDQLKGPSGAWGKLTDDDMEVIKGKPANYPMFRTNAISRNARLANSLRKVL